MKQRFTISRAGLLAKTISMLRQLKTLAMLAMLVGGVQNSPGFALLGPLNEAYQAPVIGYGLDYLNYIYPGSPVGLGDVGGPKNIAEEYRRNTPVLYYAFDANFWEFFGANGVTAVDQAFAIMNSLTNVSQYSADLSEFPLQSQRINEEAQNLALTDVKSIALHLLVEQMGLAQPDRYTWTLHNRHIASPPGCPTGASYLVIQRNFAISPTGLNQSQYSSYVNGTLYTYGIVEYCVPPNPLALAIPYAVDPLADTYTAVAANALTFGTGVTVGVNAGGVGLAIGGYYNFLTRDDVAGLRYLLRKDNYNYENSGSGTVQFVTNNFPVAATNLLYDLGLLIRIAPTNNAAALQALFPGLLVEDTTNWFPLGFTTNISLVVTTAPSAPAGTSIVIAVTNVEPQLITYYGHTYDNIITNSYSPRSVYRTQIISPGTSPFSPAGSPPILKTNTSKLITVNSPSGSFFVLPTNLCAIKILYTRYTNVVATTNVIFSLSGTNANVTGSNSTYTVSTITYFTNNWLVYLPVTCPPDTTALRGGVERIQFVRRDYDSLIGTFWAPATNRYTLTELTNSTLRSQQIQRVITQPDYLFSAQDQAVGPEAINNFVGTVLRGMNFNQVSSNGLAGPGTITSPTTFIFDKVGLFNRNYYATTLSSAGFISDQSTAISGLAWASFDGTTNDPVIYPNGTSIAGYINQILIQVQPQTLPWATNGQAYAFVYTNTVSGIAYTNTLSVTGGQAPYTWALAPGSAGLPAGLSLSADGQITGTPTGVIPFDTTYDFTVRMTDAGARTVDVPLAITLVP